VGFVVTRKVFLIRHGRTALNVEGRLRGHRDPPLDEVGEHEAAAVAEALSDWRIVKILSSPLLRALQTADAIAQVSGVTVTPVDDLIDRDYGPWTGEVEQAVIERFGSLDAAPGIEGTDTVLRRSLAVLEDQLAVLDHGEVVLVSHEAVNLALLAQLDPSLGPAVPQRTGCWNEIRRTDDGWKVTLVDQVAPLRSGLEGGDHR
jgi:probable phosphoglycerate mutase